MKVIYSFVCLAIWYLGILIFSNNRERINYDKYLHNKHAKLLTLITTFEDVKNSSDDDYRLFVQYNFLKSTKFKILRENINFVIYTNSEEMNEYITKYYPKVILRTEPKSGVFTVSMLKQLFLNAMSEIHTPFYMYTNGDILYGRNLVQTVRRVKQLMNKKLLRNKLLMIGRRSNHIMTHYIRREGDIELFARLSRVFIKDAQDYFIITRHTINWQTFPEYLVGRSGYDNAIVDFSFRNEIELIDATNTITALHQSNVKGDYLWKNHNNQEHGWNAIFWGPKIRHPSTEDSRYSTELTNGEISLFDKVTNTSIVPESNNWVNINMELILDPSHNAHTNLGPTKLTIIVLAFNRPESLNRLLYSLLRVDFGKDRIDLKVNLDIDLDNIYDIDCLKVLHQYKWIQGSYTIHKHKTHQGSLNQWLKAWQPSSILDRALILEDNTMVSRYSYRAIVREIATHQDDVTGISLEPSFITYYKHKFNPRLFFNYTTRILNLYRKSGVFIPSAKYWKYFLKWMNKIPKHLDTEFLKRAPAYQHRFHGYYTNWYEHEISVWFSYFSEFVQPLSTVYLGNIDGYLATRHYFDSKWEDFYSAQWRREYLLLDTTF